MAAEQTVAAALGIEPGLCAIIGSGGKTSLLLRLAEELPGRVIVCTSTRILPPPLPLYTGADEAALAALLQAHGVVCAGTAAEQGKLAAPALPFAALCRLADYVLVEADGSKHLPLKAHLAHEPVIPAETGQCILVVGVMGFDRPIGETAHRAAQFCALTGRQPENLARPCDIAAVLRQEDLARTVVVNQVETPEQLAQAKALASCLPGRAVYAAAVQRGACQRLNSPQGGMM